MSSLFEQISQLYDDGHSGDMPVLFRDQRLEGLQTFTPAAVLAAITERDGNPGVLLLHRPTTMRSHPGQIALPGGKIDPGESPVEAALREAHEELGIDPSAVRIIGTSDVYKTHSGFEITPVIGLVAPDVAITPNPDEVSEWFEAPLAHVLDPANHIGQWVEWEGAMRAFYQIDWQHHQIWGVTAALLVNLSRRLKWHG